MAAKHGDWYHSIPPSVQEIMQRLRGAGFTVYIVGGAVRDLVLGRIPKDFDLVTSATPDQISALFTKTIDIGKQFGISMVVLPEGNGSRTIEVATFRSDGLYKDARHPAQVRFATPEEDANRRDFTINGLFWDPEKDEIIDFVDGLKDIANRRIRTIGNAEARFSEDALRILRGLRFLSQLAPFSFSLEAETLKATAKLCPSLMRVSRERITQEMALILSSVKPSLALQHIVDIGLWYHWFGAAPSPRIFITLDAIGPTASPALRWAALVCELESIEKVESSLKHFMLSRSDQDAALTIFCDRASVLAAPTLGLAELKEFLQEETTPDALRLYQKMGENTDLAECARFCEEKLVEFTLKQSLNPPALLSGKDLLAMGFAPGPKIKAILDSVRSAQLEEKISSKEEAIHWAKNCAN